MDKTENGRVLVCVTGQRTCERLIQEGAAIAREKKQALSVVHVVRPGESVLGNTEEGEALEYLFSVSKQFGADMTMIRSEDVNKVLADYAEENRVNCIVLGISGGEGHFLKALRHRLPGMDIRVVGR